MTISQRVFETTSIDTAANLSALGFHCEVLQDPDGNRAIFEFEDTDGLRAAIIDYERGGFSKRLLNTRSRLYREASTVVRRRR